MKDYKRIEHMRNLNDSLIWERMKRCYDFGYDDGKADTPFTDTEEAENKAYTRGLNEAWEAAGKLYKISSDDFSKLFEMKSPYFDFSIQEVLAKIKKYEDKQKQDAEINVGDEVVFEDAHVVITYISPSNEWNGFLLNDCESGKRGHGYTLMKGFAGWRKTGRHFPQIAEVLAEMRGAENDK
jgi:hypothetical protein